jgi:hypothetical protein
MRISQKVLCLLILVAGGCTHRQTIERAVASPDAFARANRTLSDQSAEVRLSSGEVFRWQNVRLQPDSAFEMDVATRVVGRAPVVPTSRVIEITTRSRGRGALDGALIGLAAGAIFGVALGDQVDASTDGGIVSHELPRYTMPVGALLGMFIGAMRASRYQIQLR